MGRPLACLLVLALVGAGAALAGRGDPQKRIKPADQARAKAMMLRASDLPGFKASPASRGDVDFYCRALDESDLTLTGEALSPQFKNVLVFVSTTGQVYETQADANESWRRGTSAAGEACLRSAMRNQTEQGGATFVSFKKLSLPRLAQRSAAYRIVGKTQGVLLSLDLVVLMHSRAQVGIGFVSAVSPWPREVVVRLARTVAGRMQTAMRGA